MAKKRTDFPFLFYGNPPDSCHRGPQQLFLIRFAEPPSSELLGKLGAEAALGLHATGVVLSAEFGEGSDEDRRWAGFFTRVDGSDPTWPAFRAMPPCLERLHALAPIAEVLLATATDGQSSDWELFSVKQQERPSPIEGIVTESGEAFTRLDPWRREADEAYAAACQARRVQTRASAAFNQALAARRAELHEQAVAEARAAAEASPNPALIPLLPDSFPAPSPAQHDALGPHRRDECRLFPSGRVVALTPETYPYKIAVLDPQAETPRLIEPKVDFTALSGLNADGTRCLTIHGEHVIELDLESGEEYPVHTRQNRLGSGALYAYLDDARMVTIEGDSVLLHARAPGERGFELVAQIKVNAYRIEAALARFAFLSTGKDATTVLGIRDGTLKKLGKISATHSARYFGAVKDGEERVFARALNGCFEVVNLGSLYEKKLPAPKPKRS